MLSLPNQDQAGSDSYRLFNGHVEFRPARGNKWRKLTDSDVKLHFALDTPVGRWLAHLTNVAEVVEKLSE